MSFDPMDEQKTLTDKQKIKNDGMNLKFEKEGIVWETYAHGHMDYKQDLSRKHAA